MKHYFTINKRGERVEVDYSLAKELVQLGKKKPEDFDIIEDGSNNQDTNSNLVDEVVQKPNLDFTSSENPPMKSGLNYPNVAPLKNPDFSTSQYVAGVNAATPWNIQQAQTLANKDFSNVDDTGNPFQLLPKDDENWMQFTLMHPTKASIVEALAPSSYNAANTGDVGLNQKGYSKDFILPAQLALGGGLARVAAPLATTLGNVGSQIIAGGVGGAGSELTDAALNPSKQLNATDLGISTGLGLLLGVGGGLLQNKGLSNIESDYGVTKPEALSLTQNEGLGIFNKKGDVLKNLNASLDELRSKRDALINAGFNQPFDVNQASENTVRLINEAQNRGEISEKVAGDLIEKFNTEFNDIGANIGSSRMAQEFGIKNDLQFDGTRTTLPLTTKLPPPNDLKFSSNRQQLLERGIPKNAEDVMQMKTTPAYMGYFGGQGIGQEIGRTAPEYNIAQNDVLNQQALINKILKTGIKPRELFSPSTYMDSHGGLMNSIGSSAPSYIGSLAGSKSSDLYDYINH